MTVDRDEKFLDKSNWSEIKRGYIFEAAVPYTGERPLDFFIVDKDDPYRGTVVGKNGDFSSGKVHHVIIGLKQRKVIIISNEDICLNNDIFDITVAPIYTIYEEDKAEEWYKDAVNSNHLFYSYLPDVVTGRECVVDLSNIITINKNMLLTKKRDATKYMSDIDRKMEYCLQLGLYKKSEKQPEEEVS